jgi:hypothetical protein
MIFRHLFFRLFYPGVLVHLVGDYHSWRGRRCVEKNPQERNGQVIGGLFYKRVYKKISC